MNPVRFSSADAVRFFTRATFRDISNGYVPSMRELGIDSSSKKTANKNLVSVAVDNAYALLRSEHRCEYVYKNEIVSRVIFGRHSPKTASFCGELAVGSSVADVVVFNGTSTVYEIKTELDSLKRLPTQLNDYVRAFDRIHVVTHEAAVDAVLNIAPKCVGVFILGREGKISQVRESISNKANIDPAVLFGCLRRGEYLSILERTHGWTGKVTPAKLVAEARGRFVELSPEVAHTETTLEMRKRTTDSQSAGFVESLPYSLRALGLSQPLSLVARARVQTVLQGLTIGF